jgi:anti-sigma factor RsiW
MDDEFDILAAKVLTGEATQKERAEFQSMLANSPELSAEFAALQSTWNSLKKAAPVIQAETAPPAEIPAERLQQLQRVVRDARRPSPSVQSNRHRNEGPKGFFLSDIFRHWRERWNGAVPAMVSAAFIVLLAGTLFWLNPGATPRNPLSSSAAPVAHLLVLQGRPDVHRDGQLLPAATAFTLRAGDKVHLPSGTEASVVTPGGDVPLKGPQTTTALELAAAAGVSNRRTNQMGQASGLHTALFQPTPELLKAGLLVTTRSVQTIPLYSPAGATVHLTPVILWKTEPGKTYDLRLTDEFDSATPPWTLSGATPPVEFAKVEAWKGRPLAVNGLYRLRISESGRALTTCEYTFRTVKEEPDSPPNARAHPLQAALRTLTDTPSRVGDALAVLLTLPPELTGSELALRLRLVAFGQLGYQADFEEAASALRPAP